ncbi:MAG: hypothetical protein IPL65_22520 [Lewinellaceae bacterium]|nr:hypothetical protein [Lewinellaceae bacterium]
MYSEKLFLVASCCWLLSVAACHKQDGDRKPAFFKNGASMTYAFIYRSDASFVIDGLSGMDKKQDPSITELNTFVGGYVEIQSLGKFDSMQIVRLAFRDVYCNISQNGQPLGRAAEKISQGLQHHFYLEYQPSGRLAHLIFAPEMPGEAQNYAAAITAPLQFSTCLATSCDSIWEAIEDDQYGACLVQYRQNPRSFQSAIVKNKLGYSDSNQSDMSYEYYPASVSRLKLRSDGCSIDSCWSEEEVRTFLNQQQCGSANSGLSFVLNNSRTLDKAEIKRLRDAYLALKTSEPALRLFEVSALSSNAAIAVQTLGNDQLQNVFLYLKNLDTQGKKERTLAFLKCRALLTLQPFAADSLVRLFKGTSLRTPSMVTLVDAMASAGTPAAQIALLHMLEQRTGDSYDCFELLEVLSKIEKPRQEVLRFLEKTIREHPDEYLQEKACLSLGTLAWRLRDTRPEAGKKAAAFLKTQLDLKNTLESKTSLILALGNTGHASIDPWMRAIVSDTLLDLQLRQTALWAMRLLSQEDTDTYLLSIAGNTASPLRATAFKVINSRPASRQQAIQLADMYKREDNTDIRHLILISFRRYFAAYPEISNALLLSALNDPNAEIQKTAGLLLQEFQ